MGEERITGENLALEVLRTGMRRVDEVQSVCLTGDASADIGYVLAQEDGNLSPHEVSAVPDLVHPAGKGGVRDRIGSMKERQLVAEPA